MWFCRTDSYTCSQTSDYYNPSSGQCEVNLGVYLPGQTTGVCYEGQSSCRNNCSAPRPTDRPTPVPTDRPTPPPGEPSCRLNLAPSSASTSSGDTTSFTAVVSDVRNGTFQGVIFSSSNASVASVSSDPDESPPYLTTASSQSDGSATIRAQGYMNNVVECSDTSTITVSSGPPPTVPPTPTPGAGQCPAPPRPVDPPVTSCSGATYSATWEWNAVWDADAGDWIAEYRLRVDDEFGGSFENTGWTSAAVFGCAGGGVCSYTSTGLTSGVSYYSRVRARGLCSESNWSDTVWVTETCGSCEIDLVPGPTWEIDLLGTQDFFVSFVTPPAGPIDKVDFSSSDPAVVSVNPSEDFVAAFYETQATANSFGSATITADVIVGGVPACSGETIVDIANSSAWWQVKEGDVVADGVISSTIPITAYDANLITHDLGEFPGVATYRGSINPVPLDPNPPDISSTDWNTNSVNSPNEPDYAFFEGRVSSSILTDVTITTVDASDLASVEPIDGYYWLRYDGAIYGNNLTIEDSAGGDVNLGNNKVVLFVDEADLTINSRILLDDGEGFLLVIVDRDIIVDPSVGGPHEDPGPLVPDLEGIYITDQQFSTGEGDEPLHVRGSVVGIGGISLDRDLSDNSLYPAELFEYGIDQILAFPSDLTPRQLIWREVAP